MVFRKIPFWLQIVTILLAGMLTSIAVVAVIPNSDTEVQDVQSHTVTFAYLDGTILRQDEVPHGKGVFPPKLTDKGVFCGWSKGINVITADVEVHPLYYSIKENNQFYFNSTYVQEGDKFSLELFVGGHVSVSSGELTLEYDPEVLHFRKLKPVENCLVKKVEKGKLKIIFSSPEPIKTEKMLAELIFSAKEKDVFSTEIILNAANVYVCSLGQKLPVDYATINNKIYFLQEVEE